MPTICSPFTVHNKVKHTLTATSLQTYWQRNEIFKGVNSSEGDDWKHFHISGKEHFNTACQRYPVKPSCVPDNTFSIVSSSIRVNFCHWFYCKIRLMKCTHGLLYSNDNFLLASCYSLGKKQLHMTHHVVGVQCQACLHTKENYIIILNFANQKLLCNCLKVILYSIFRRCFPV